jgi:hypothetical protein
MGQNPASSANADGGGPMWTCDGTKKNCRGNGVYGTDAGNDRRHREHVAMAAQRSEAAQAAVNMALPLTVEPD